MSHIAMGWAQRQKLGDPIGKAVLTHMCYVMRDESLLVYVSIPTLEEFTEYEDRAIRKAIQRMVDNGTLLDTGKKRNNVPVYRIPGFEEHLRRLFESTPANGGASPTDLAALAHVAELAKEKSVNPTAPTKPSPTREGQHSSPPVDVPKPSRVGTQAPPSTGPNLPSDLPLPSGSDDPRAIPTGSRVALDSKGNPFDETTSRRFWWGRAISYALSSAELFEICARGTQHLHDLALYARAALEEACRDATQTAVEMDRGFFPEHRRRESEIDTCVRRRIDRDLKLLRPKTFAERTAAGAGAR
jgi:hypothetical protein